MFDIPVAFFIFKRVEKSVHIIRKIAEARPQKLYIISDAGRNNEEKKLVETCREAVESSIDWPCEIIKMYADVNKGCYNIGLSAMEIFKNEPMCIFLEDDNEPAPTFFQYCKDLLLKYKDNDDILWICGTNYMQHFEPKDGADYVFTKHMLPCGWASWGEKFNRYYEYDFQHLNPRGIKQARKSYSGKRLFRYDKKNWLAEQKNKHIKRYMSWDYHMNFSVRYYGKLGIAPCYNQITNIGADAFSAHGGSSMDYLLTNRFCMVPAKNFTFPLKAPQNLEVNQTFEILTEKIIMPPRRYFYKCFLRRLIPMPRNISITQSIKEKRIVRRKS